tara:strand:- start:31 stop:330 length:300 start_codon:yes stop_codon:yes gene_type:complete
MPKKKDNSKDKKQTQLEVEEAFEELPFDFSEEDMRVAEKIAEEVMRHDDPEKYEKAKKEKNEKIFKEILLDLFNFGKKREIRYKLEQIEQLSTEIRKLL